SRGPPGQGTRPPPPQGRSRRPDPLVMIVWLASYPRSGNTLLRQVLHQCFGLSSFEAPDARSQGMKRQPGGRSAPPTEVTSSMPLCVYFSFTGCDRPAVRVRLRIIPPGDRIPAPLDVEDERRCEGEFDVREFMVAATVTFPSQGTSVLEAVDGEVLIHSP